LTSACDGHCRVTQRPATAATVATTDADDDRLASQ